MGKLITTVVTVLVAVGCFAAIWVGANLAVEQAARKWQRFAVARSAVVGFIVVGLLHGNRALRSLGTDFFWLWPIVGAACFGALALAVSLIPKSAKTAVGAVGGAGIGVFLGTSLDSLGRPELEWVPIIAATLIIGVLAAGFGSVRGISIARSTLTGAAAGWLIGAFALSEVATGQAPRSHGVLALVVPGLLLGAAMALAGAPDSVALQRFDHRARAVLFLGPALLFISVALIIPTLRTLYLSLLDRSSVEYVGLDNYREVFQDKTSFDRSRWEQIFTSQLFYFGIVLVAVGLLLGLVLGRRRGDTFVGGGSTLLPIGLGAFLLVFAVFSSLRGTIINNLWWVFTVTIVATVLGLAFAVLSDGVKWESVAKSFIFMPMAISFVGAAIIWRFMYIARDIRKPQTGVFNGTWVQLGRLSNSGWPRALVVILLVLALGGLLALAFRARRAEAAGIQGASLLLVLPLAWLIYRFLGPGLGGFSIAADGTVEPETVLFLQEQPFNSVFLMIILIWIQTGFAMVILSAAIKAVPTEFVEAARMDGATAPQVFWNITLPQIAPTIGVVTTTIMVLVMKVFDIVKVTTNGQFGSQVLANDMYDKAFNKINTGTGAALASIIFISILPVMVLNVHRMQEESV